VHTAPLRAAERCPPERWLLPTGPLLLVPEPALVRNETNGIAGKAKSGFRDLYPLETKGRWTLISRGPPKSGSDFGLPIRDWAEDVSSAPRGAKVQNVTGSVQPTQQAPPVQRLRVRYARRGRARFTSHRDFGRAFERALRRAGVPMAYSSGFSPHPRISYANAAPTGAASEAEYLEIALAEICDPEKVRVALDAALPPGLDVVEVVPASAGALADQLTGSRWRIDLPGMAPGILADAVERFLAATSVQVERMTRTGLREFDARSAVVSLRIENESLVVVVAHQIPLVRPDDVITALSNLAPELAAVVPVSTRLSQGRLDPATGEITEP
jgi:radical SAM-linked protein